MRGLKPRLPVKKISIVFCRGVLPVSIVFCGSRAGEGQALALRFFEVCCGQLFAIRRSQTTDGAPVVQERQILNGMGTSALTHRLSRNAGQGDAISREGSLHLR